jgi:thiol-disulfide isomerase/thioredoxin
MVSLVENSGHTMKISPDVRGRGSCWCVSCQRLSVGAQGKDGPVRPILYQIASETANSALMTEFPV